MPVQSIFFNAVWVFGGNNGLDGTVTISFSPSPAVAQTSLSSIMSTGALVGGIHQYTTPNPDPTLPDLPTIFSYNPDYGLPPIVYDPNMTSVTAELGVGGDNTQAVLTLTVYLFS